MRGGVEFASIYPTRLLSGFVSFSLFEGARNSLNLERFIFQNLLGIRTNASGSEQVLRHSKHKLKLGREEDEEKNYEKFEESMRLIILIQFN